MAGKSKSGTSKKRGADPLLTGPIKTMKPSESMTTIEMPALGRPFSLGMLYDCRNEQLIPGITLWNSEALRENVALESKDQTSLEIITSDTVSDKSSAMNINASLAASFLSGLVSVSGSATYMNDTKKSRNQARVTLKYSRTTRFEQLTMNHLGTQNMAYPDVFEKGTATHVVTGILYGAQAFFIFDQDVSTSENTQGIQGTLHIMIKKIPSISVDGKGSLSMNDQDKEQVCKFSCKFYGDFALDRNPVTYEDAIAIYTSLPKLLGEKGDKAVPVRVWLYPLNKLDSKAAQLVRDISNNFVLKTESVVQQMVEVNMQCNELMRHPAAETFPDSKKKISQFRYLCIQFTHNFQKQLAQILPSIRGGGSEDVALMDILTTAEQSPLGEVHIKEFLSHVEQELNVLKTYMDAMPDIIVKSTETTINEVILNPNILYVVCYNFSSLNEEDPYLTDISQWLLSHKHESKNNVYEKKKVTPWFKVTDVSKKLRTCLKAFKKFAKVNASRDEIKCIISSVPDQSNPGVSIYLYGSGELVSAQFEPPAQPHLPVIRSKTHDSMELTLMPANFGKKFIKSYKIEYRCANDKIWTPVITNDSNEEVTIRGLKPNSVYQIRYSAVCIAGLSEVNDALEDEKTHPTSPPETIKVTAESSTLIIHWNKPAVIGDGVTITEYIVEYKKDVDNGQQTWLEKKTGKKEEKYIIQGLKPMTSYIVRVSAACGDDGLSTPSHEIKVSTQKESSIIKYEFLKKSIVLTEGKPLVYQLATDCCDSHYRHYSLGNINNFKTNKVILLVGATGTGKTTLINGMANYILGVDWENDFRFKLVCEVAKQCQAHSQTAMVTAYQMNHEDGYKIPFTLTLIDTPGFGDTRGIEHDKKITEAIYKFFTTDSKINQIDAVCFVVQASLARLTFTQKYIFNSVFSIFGKDIKDNILILINFSDEERPPVLEAIKTADIPYSQESNGDPVHFKFNNSALFANNQTSNMSFNQMFWDMGTHSMKTFFTSLNQMTTKSLKLTKEVLKERKELEVTLQALHSQIKAGLVKLDEIRKIKVALQQNRDLMEANKNFESEVTVTIPVKEAITGNFITIKKNYEKASGEVMTAENVFKELQNEYCGVRQAVLNLIEKSSQSLKRLRETALRPNPMKTTEYIDLMIQSEQQEAKPGYQESIKSLSDVRETAEIIEKIERGDPLLPEEEEHHNKSKPQEVVKYCKNLFKPLFK
ncbi:uncharacterized protein LOC128659696 [Bombina bombina]|uniref:uncharacterized protein LOC128659696 n=1 Tax=Bombina bombina TaxID=8345 RepID=UPI00235A7D7C|nr:uncharacterized protein LOC128659696 [Bombina bombina]